MNMHQVKRSSDGELLPDWQLIPEDDRNRAQRIAAGTDGTVTIPNVMSAAGLGLVANGVNNSRRGNKIKGLAEIVAGRLLDLADGHIAHKQGVKSPLGRKVDVACDRGSEILALGLPDVPGWYKAAIVAPQLANAGIYQAAENGHQIQSNKEGKLATFSRWTAIGSFVLAGCFENRGESEASHSIRKIAIGTAAVSVALNTKAVWQYYKETRNSSKAKSGQYEKTYEVPDMDDYEMNAYIAVPVESGDEYSFLDRV